MKLIYLFTLFSVLFSIGAQAQQTFSLRMKGSSVYYPFEPAQKSDVTIKKVNPFLHPLKALDGEKVLTITQGKHSFEFIIPEGSIDLAGDINVNQSLTSQDAFLGVKSVSSLINEEEVIGKSSCHYSGRCKSWIPDTFGKMTYAENYNLQCEGTQDVLFKVGKYQRTLEITLVRDRSSTTFKTTPTEKIKKEVIQQLTECRP